MTTPPFPTDSNIFVAGHKGMVGSAVVRKLKSSGYKNIIVASKEEVDLTNQSDTDRFFNNISIDAVILCAAKVGGILANNNYRADFINQNLQIGVNVINASHKFKVKKLINLGSSCIYPKNVEMPIKEESLLSGYLEYTNEPYAVAKIAVLKMCQSFYDQYGSNYYSVMPCNLYGKNDNFNLETSHVLPALIHKVHLAKENGSESVVLWGTGKPLREFLYADEVASAIHFLLKNVDAEQIYSQQISHINCGSNDEVTILDLLKTIKKIVGYKGDIVFDSSKPDGTFRKKMDNSRLTDLGFQPEISLEQGLRETYDWFLENFEFCT